MQDRAGKRISKIKQKPFRVGTFVSNFNVYTKCIKDSKTRNSDFTYDGLNMTCAGNKLVKTEDTGFSVTLSLNQWILRTMPTLQQNTFTIKMAT